MSRGLTACIWPQQVCRHQPPLPPGRRGRGDQHDSAGARTGRVDYTIHTEHGRRPVYYHNLPTNQTDKTTTKRVGLPSTAATQPSPRRTPPPPPPPKKTKTDPRLAVSVLRRLHRYFDVMMFLGGLLLRSRWLVMLTILTDPPAHYTYYRQDARPPGPHHRGAVHDAAHPRHARPAPLHHHPRALFLFLVSVSVSVSLCECSPASSSSCVSCCRCRCRFLCVNVSMMKCTLGP